MAGPTRIEAQGIENTGEDIHVERRFSEIMPNEKRARVFRRVEPSPRLKKHPQDRQEGPKSRDEG